MRVENENIDILFAANAVDSRTAGVSGSRPDNVHLFSPLFEQVFEEVAEQLQGNILEGKGRPMEKLKDMHAVFIDNRGDFRMGEGCVGTVDESFKVCWRDIVSKRGDDVECQFLIGEVAP